MTKLKHITVNEEVYQKLKNLGKAGDSFNDVLIRILSVVVVAEQKGGEQQKDETDEK